MIRDIKQFSYKVAQSKLFLDKLIADKIHFKDFENMTFDRPH